jgi:arylsulfatase A-like enzyme
MGGCGLGALQIPDVVRLVDVLPSILDFSGLDNRWMHLEGSSVFPVARGSSSPTTGLPVFAMGTLYGPEKYCLIEDGMKLIVNTENQHHKSALIGYMSSDDIELYDLHNDPLEEENLRAAEGNTAARLYRALKILGDSESPFEPRGVILDEDLKESLKSLGYL